MAGSQLSVVHPFPSSQLGGAPTTQTPPLQTSCWVHASESSQGAVLFVCTHPVAGLQLSSVQGLPSLQLSAGPLLHLEPRQLSCVVHASPSSQGSRLWMLVHPNDGLHPSLVHRFPSSHSRAGPPVHPPPEQLSCVVHALPSSQGAVFWVWVHPVAESHPSSVHALPSLQLFAGPSHVPLAQASGAVHASPSLQAVPVMSL